MSNVHHEPDAGPVPEDNQPGHHPDVEQDKPKVRVRAPFPEVGSQVAEDAPATDEAEASPQPDAEPQPDAGPQLDAEPQPDAEPRSDAEPQPDPGMDWPAAAPGASSGPARRFAFAFEPRMVPFAAAAGVAPRTSGVDVDGDRVTIRFGFWSLTTERSNVAGATITGPYRWWKVAGPPHLSLVDRGVTFATATGRGVCIRFHEPVRGIDPVGLLRHPAATVTVDDPEGLVSLLGQG
jgi:hypothetical protein